MYVGLRAATALAVLPEEGGDALAAVAEVEANRRTLDALPALTAVEAELAWAPLGQVVARLGSVADARDTHPLIAARAGALVAALDRAAGRLAQATDRTARMRLIDAWSVAPAPDPSTPCEDADPPAVGWVDVSGLTPDGVVRLDSLVWPSDEGATFAAARLLSERPIRAVLRLGASAGTTVWLDGAVVADEPGLRDRVVDQLTIPVALGAGPHSLVIRVCPGDEHGASLVARISDAAGRPDPRVTWAAEAPPEEPTRAPAPPAGGDPRVVDAWATWVAHASAGATEEERRRAVRVLAGSGRSLPPELEAAALLGDDADSLLLRALLETEPNRRVELLRGVLDRDGERVRAMLELAETDLARQRYLAARALLDEAESRSPGLARTRVLRARLLSENQVPGEGLRLLREARQAAPGVPAVLSALGSLAWQQNALGPAREAFEALALIAPDPTETGFWLFEIARLQGRAEDALSAVDRLIAARPDVAGHRLMKARYLTDLGRADAARAALAAIPAALRGSPDLREGIGRLRHRLGDEEAAVADLRESLRLRPQNPDLRAAIARLQPDQARPEDAWLEDPRAVRATPVAPDAPDTEVLLDQKIVRVFPNGLSAATWQRVVRVNHVAPGDTSRDVHIPYDPFKQTVDVLRAEIHGIDGTVRPVTEREEQSLSEAWYGLYYDLRHIVVPFRGLRDGDVLVLEHRVSDVGRNLISDAFSDLSLLGDVAPKRRVRYVLLAPPERTLHAALVDPTGEAQWTEDEGMQGDLRVRVWEVSDLPAIPVEDRMPGYAEVSPWIHVSTFASYEEVGRTWWALVEPQAQVTPAMRAHVKSLVEGIEDPLERVRRIHDDLVRSNRYVGLEFGIHGFKPYPSSQVFERRFGDCKDQSLLLKVMLAEAGIEAKLVLVRTRSLGRVPEEPASLDVFDHAICQVPSLGLWLDPTADSNGIWELPAEDQGATALVVDADGGTLVQLPESEALDNVRSRVFEVEPGQTGDAIRGRLQAAGLFAPELRKSYRTRATREALLGEQLGAVFPGFRLTTATFAGVEDLKDAVDITYEGVAPDVTEGAGGAVVLFPPDPPDELVRRLAPDVTRKQDLLLDQPFIERRVERLLAPPGWAPSEEARAESVESAFGTYTVRIGVDGRAAVRERTLELRARRVSKDDWGAFRDFLRRADALGHAPISVRPGGQS